MVSHNNTARGTLARCGFTQYDSIAEWSGGECEIQVEEEYGGEDGEGP